MAELLAEKPGEELAFVYASILPIAYYRDALALLLEAGVAIMVIADRVENMQWSGLNASKHLYWSFDIIPTSSAGLVGSEICRMTGPGYKHSVLKVYGSEGFDGRGLAALSTSSADRVPD